MCVVYLAEGSYSCLTFRSFGGEKSFDEGRGTLEEKTMSPGKVEGRRRGGCVFSTSPQREGEAVDREEILCYSAPE